MGKYKTITNNIVFNNDTGMFIPLQEDSAYRKEYHLWIAAGNAADPSDIPRVISPDELVQIRFLVSKIRKILVYLKATFPALPITINFDEG